MIIKVIIIRMKMMKIDYNSSKRLVSRAISDGTVPVKELQHMSLKWRMKDEKHKRKEKKKERERKSDTE